LAQFIANGAASLRYNDTEELATVSGGVYVPNKLGIGTNAPAEVLEVYNATSPAIQLNDGGDYKAIMRLAGNDLELRSSSGNMEFYTGNADGDSSTERFRIDSAGRVLIGTTASRITSGVTPNFVIEGTSYNTNSMGIFANINGVLDSPVMFFGKSRGTSDGSNTIVQNGDRLFSMRIDGSDGTNLEQAAIMEAYVDGSPAANSIPGRFTFMTTPAGTQYATERMRIDSNGYTQFGAHISTHIGTSQVFINRGVNAAAVTSGTTQTGSALRLRGGDNAILDMGMNSVNTWIQATDRANLANLYSIALNPNGGGVTVGQAASSSDRFEVYKNTNGNFATYIVQDNAGGYGMGVRGDSGSMIYFYIGGTYQGHIYSSGGSTTYGTGSDYRLKNNVVEMKGAINDLKKLRPVTFNFKESPDVPQQGFIAHEAQEVVPHAVAGEKDAKIDEEHQIGYQSMEYGKVTPLLTAALQEALAKIETLETKVAALESK